MLGGMITTDSAPSSKVAAQEAEVERLRRQLEIAEAVLRGMRAMLPDGPTSLPTLNTARQVNLSTHQQATEAARPTTGFKGRQPGAISHQWRDTLHFLYLTYRDGFTEHNAARAAQEAGLSNVRARDALDRMKAYISLNYIEEYEDKFRVTEFAVQKYGFDRKENEPSSGFAVGSDAADEGAPPPDSALDHSNSPARGS
jgi:hypothetical protein